MLGVDADGRAVCDRGRRGSFDGATPMELREAGASMTQEDGGLVAYAAAIAGWHRRHRFCANCGTPTHSGEAGHVRECPNCGAIHHPRTDPVVIMLVHDGERALLGRQPQWPDGRYSALAGFVEPGESLEEAVAREVLEEAGVVVGDVLYRSSQPWPFPSSLMLGFHAAYADGEATVRDRELADVRWFTREELVEIARGRHRRPPPAAARDRPPPHRRVVDRRAGPLSSLSPEVMQGSGPAVSVVIPARNAESTLARALESLLAQSERSFEAIVVENGSADRTGEVAREFARRDRRVRVTRRTAAGVSAARNAGIALARGEWLLFHDADDTLDPDALARLLSEARREPRPDAAVCGWARVAPDGTRFDEFIWEEADEAFQSLAVTCAFAIHCCLVRRELVLAAGGFDESLATCEDWDLWLRLARMGARFRAIPERLARYHVHPGTASLDGRRMLVDGLEVLGRAHAPDPRVGRPDPRFAEGRDRRLLVPSRMACACFAAGLALGAGHDARPLLDELGDDRCSKLDPVTVAWCIYAAAPLAGAYSPDRWEELWPLVEQGLDPFLEQLERRTSPGLAHRARHELERLVLARSGAPLPLAIGSRLAVGIELTEPLEGVSVEPSVERLLCRVEHDGQPLGSVELPVCDGEVPADVLADSLAAELFWPLLGRFFSLEPVEHDRDGWATFLCELWGKPGWDEDRFYEAAATNGAPGQLRPTRGRVRLEVSEPLPDLRTRGRLLLVDVTVGGAPVGVVRLRPGRAGSCVRRSCAPRSPPAAGSSLP